MQEGITREGQELGQVTGRIVLPQRVEGIVDNLEEKVCRRNSPYIEAPVDAQHSIKEANKSEVDQHSPRNTHTFDAANAPSTHMALNACLFLRADPTKSL